METELKFALSPEARGRIERHGLPLAAGGHARTQAHCTRYFDTPERALWKAGFTLRVREKDDGFVQTVKSDGDGIYHRHEWEWSVSSRDPERALLAKVPGLPPLGDAALEPVFRTDIQRTRTIVTPAAGTKVELAFDDGAVIAHGAGEPLSELELELKSGDEQALLRLGLDLLEVAPLVLQAESKAERGYRLSDGWQRPVRKPAPVPLDRGVSVQQGFARLSSATLDDLLLNQPAVLRGDEVEGVHQVRVGIRRLRSLLMLFEPVLERHGAARFSSELRRLGLVLGAARDWDVFLAESLPAVIETAADLRTIEPLRGAADQCRHAAHQDAKKAVQEPSFARFVLAFRAWSQSAEATMSKRIAGRPLEELAPTMLDRVARKVGKRLALSDPDDPQTLHDLRKSAKKLRYAIEFLDSLYAGKSEHYYERCTALQKRLGKLNDLVTLRRLAQELTAKRLDLAPALGVLENHSASLIARELERIDKPFARMERERPFW